MAVMPFTDPARAWRGFRKDVLNMKGGFVILVILVACLAVHWVDSFGLLPPSGASSTIIFPRENSGNALNLQNSAGAKVTQNIVQAPPPEITDARVTSANTLDTLQGSPVFKTEFVIAIKNPGDAPKLPVHYSAPALAASPEFSQISNVADLEGNGLTVIKSFKVTFYTKEKADGSQFKFWLDQGDSSNQSTQ